MIDAKDLRIGNWVFGKNDPPMRVISISNGSVELRFDGVDEDYGDWSYDDDELRPIPLDSTILERCGFVRNNEEYANSHKDNEGYNFYEHMEGYFIISEKDNVFRKYWHIDEDTFYSWHGIEVKYLHSLMNLYYSLTGTEIIYQP